MHSGRSHTLSEPDLLSRKIKQLRNAAFVVARQSERVGNRTLKRHVKEDSTPARRKRGEISRRIPNLRQRLNASPQPFRGRQYS